MGSLAPQCRRLGIGAVSGILVVELLGQAAPWYISGGLGAATVVVGQVVAWLGQDDREAGG